MMASGSNTMSETVPRNLAEWRPSYKDVIRKLATELRSQSSPAMVRILVVPGKLEARDFLKRTLEEVVDELGMNKRVVVAVQRSEKDVWALVVEWDKMVKLVHPLLAEEILRQYGGGEERWKLGLNDLAIDFARQLLQAAGGYTDEVSHVFQNLFIDREDWSMDETTPRRELFSPLIEKIPSNAARGRLLEVLTELSS